MVAKVAVGKNILGILNYNENKVKEGTASLILAYNFGAGMEKLAFNDKLSRFEKLINKNTRTKTNAIHISLNFETSENISKDKLMLIAETYMRKIGFDRQPFLVYEHKDAAHPHIHIATTNIMQNGKRIDLHNLPVKASLTASKEIEREFNLIKAEERSRKNIDNIKPIRIEKAIYGKTETKSVLSNIVREIIRSYKYTSLSELNAVLGCFNVIAVEGKEGTLMKKKNGLCYSIINEKGEKVGVPIKSSSIYGKPTLSFLEKQFQLNEMLRKPSRPSLITRIDHVLKLYDLLSKDTFKAELAKEGIAVVFRENKKSVTYGVTYVDHKTRTVFNGSDLGKQYSINGLLEKLKGIAAIKPSDQDSKGLTVESIKNQIPHSLSHQIDTIKSDPSTSISIDIETSLSDLLEAKEVKSEFGPPGFSRRKKRKRRQNL